VKRILININEAHHAEEGELLRVGVLVLVDQHVAVEPLYALPHLGTK